MTVLSVLAVRDNAQVRAAVVEGVAVDVIGLPTITMLKAEQLAVHEIGTSPGDLAIRPPGLPAHRIAGVVQ
jgi:hypothetical protein